MDTKQKFLRMTYCQDWEGSALKLHIFSAPKSAAGMCQMSEAQCYGDTMTPPTTCILPHNLTGKSLVIINNI